MGQQNQRFTRRNLQQNVQQHSNHHPDCHTSSPTPTQHQQTSNLNRPMHHQEDRGATRQIGASAVAPGKLDISDVRDPSEINQLTARQLKVILTRNCVDYRGVFEKEVLREKVLQLWIDYNERKSSRNPVHTNTGSHNNVDDIDERIACKICMEREINCVFLECGHMLACIACGRKLAECPVCRQNITRCVRTFKG